MSDEEVCGVEDDAGKTKSANEEDEEDEEDVLMERKVDADDASVDAEDDIVERRARTTTTSSELEDLERKLSSKDFIMEPECLDHVKRYIASGGAPSTAIELLSENYRGYAAMTSLAAHWLKLTAPPKPGANTSPIKVSATVAGQRNGDGHERTPTGGILAANEPASGEKARGDGSANTSGGNARFDEMYFLETLVREKFDATMADRVFEGRPPAWLDGIFKSERGRALLFSLAESNPNCLLISCAIQHAWQRGMRHEVRALGPAAAAYFSIFHELLADHVKNIVLAGDDEVRRSDAEARVKSMCCQSIGTYAFGQMMLASLARGEVEDATSESARALATRLSQEIEEAAAGLHGAAAVRRLAPWLSATSEDASAKRATSDLLQARPVGGSASDVKPSAMAAGDLKKLRDLYFSDESKPSVAPLRHPDVLYNLITEAFKWNLSANRQRDACFDLIALAVSDETVSVEYVKKALNQAVEVVEVAKRGESPDKSSFARAIEVPSAAAGIIAAVRTALTNDDYHRIVQVGNTNALFIEMLGDIARKHIALQAAVLEALSAIISTCGRSHGDELVISLLDLGCDLIAAGHVLPTLAAACHSWSSSLEASQMRYFANEVLEIAGPPYSRDFAVVLIRLLETSNSRKGMSKSVDEFVEEVRLKRREFKPALGIEFVNTLEYLSR
jgi:negative elongation factor C/D